MQTNSVLLMKGDAWPGIEGFGLTHKSPDVNDDPPPKRLLLKVDLNNFRPVLGVDREEDDEESDNDEREENGARRRLRKRLVTSQGFSLSKTWKIPRRR